MADNDLQVIVKAKELATHTFVLTSNSKGVLSEEKFNDSYRAWKNHISHGNCHKLAKSMDGKVKNCMKSKYYKTCELCGANLDPNEKCTCLQEAKEKKDRADINKKATAMAQLLAAGRSGKNAKRNKAKARGIKSSV